MLRKFEREERGGRRVDERIESDDHSALNISQL